MNSYSLFRRSRLRLALWYAGVMGAILSVSGFGMYRAMAQANWAAMEREIESIAGTLHDSVEPLLPAAEEPTAVLQQIFPDLCLSGRSCNATPTLIQRHTIGISDRTTYYIRLFDRQGKLLAFSPNQPLSLPKTLNRTLWQTFRAANGIRYHQFTTVLHSDNTHHQPHEPSVHSSWGYLQIGRTLEPFDAEIGRIQWIIAIGFPIVLSLVAASSWWLSGLAMQPIYQSYQQQQQFTANAAHELRSPLASLLATVEAILRIRQSNRQDIQMMLHTVERQGRRLSHLVADLLLLTSLEQNSSLKPFQPCCLNDLVSDLTEEFLELATASDIHLTCQIPTFEIYALGNESQLYRLVSNLIANAIQYTSKGGYVTVSLVTCDACGGHSHRTAVIAVKDTGIGIPLAQQNRIFDRFYRVDGDRSRKTGGTGLGLAIAQAIAQKHQASLRVESQVGKGSIFTLELTLISSNT
ncbi:two-component system sensor histidine kinase RppB [Chroococcidiopsis thermalis]|uniref:histidine kinase n=1 Tax=Chroococcidiopsis thermalis (strain PCC 7203) TaxID=251229 RepID=K9UAK9_CHRTP|nr:two-component system sensor histidine kinase RppB [Chroococcidiopsis thermalis]AFY91254.1 integral membrane sensor signal transduction histidine kinase [Chroococcidiopsis thermalis PCC 7203]